MEMEKRSVDGIPPYRMAQITKTAADVADRIASGNTCLTLHTRSAKSLWSWYLRQSVNAKMNKEDKDVY